MVTDTDRLAGAGCNGAATCKGQAHAKVTGDRYSRLLPYLHNRLRTGLPLWMLGLGADLLWADMNRLLAFLFHQGVLDEQFLQLQQLQDETSPNFVSEVVNIYFHESEKLLRNLRALLMEREFSDYKKMGIHLNQFMGSSSSIGAKRVRNVCVAFRAATEQNNRASCLRALEMLEHEYCYLKNKLHELFQIEQQRALAAGVRYPVQN
ncbi:histidine-containing phosphotransfer protein 6, partial [Mucuna pruriens]